MFTVSLYFHGNSNCHTGQGCNDRLQIPHGAAPEMRPRGGSRPDPPAAGRAASTAAGTGGGIPPRGLRSADGRCAARQLGRCALPPAPGEPRSPHRGPGRRYERSLGLLASQSARFVKRYAPALRTAALSAYHGRETPGRPWEAGDARR